MKKILLIVFAFVCIQGAYAQQGGKFRFGMDLGIAAPQGGNGIGAVFNLEPKVNLTDNLNIGLRMGTAALAKNVTINNVFDEVEGEASGTVSFAGTFDYYFNKGNSSVAPFIGGGVGYYTMANVEVNANQTNVNYDDLTPSNAWGGLVRAGIELAKFRMAAEYNIIPDTDLQDAQGNVIGISNNKYFAFTLGFYVGGGKWRK